ncbi:phage tail protein I [Comamonas kerstersii]|uniref:Phage tail protein I n=1 Tax=Comamonas kerstersii TaxID=225992 RepID=A0A1V0BI39_9BURK|nr:phage tail protein I [Comamonas kerstersii]AQZ99596.1 phage tail protein I [Comamonas kerstersii]
MSSPSTRAATLLPPNATPLERALAKASAMPHSPEEIRQLWNHLTCPLHLLPWLAWAWSVDEWDPAWTEGQQRAMVGASIRLHKKKGTVWAVREALLRSGLESVRVIEKPVDAEHWSHFDVDIAVVDRPLTQGAIQRAHALIEENKAQRSVLRTLRTSMQSRGGMYFAMQLLCGTQTTVYPLQAKDITPEPVAMHMAFGTHGANTTTVYPMTAP